MFKKKKQSGFIALTSVLLFGALILVMGLSMASTSISEQAMTGYEKGGEKAISAANACVDLGVSRVKNGEASYDTTTTEVNLYDDVDCNLSFSQDPEHSYRVKVTGTASVDTSQRSFSHTEYAYVDNHEFIPGLVGYWPMDENRGSAVYNEASDDRESYLDFDGVDDYVNLGNLNDYLNPNNMSWSFWVKPTRNARDTVHAYDFDVFIGKHDGGASGDLAIGYIRDNIVRVYYENLLSTGYIDSLDSIPINNWTHILVTTDVSGVSLYINGVFNSRGNISTNFVINNVGVGGAITDIYSTYFGGQADDVRVYNRALSETEIQKLYNETENITDGLVGHWDMDETFGDLAVDSSGNNNHGTIYGAKRGGSKGKYVGIEAFTTVGSHTWTVPEGVTEVDVLVVGGGGGGGSNYGGGGGAGGLIFEEGYGVSGDISIEVGGGGIGSATTSTAAMNGGNSSFGSLTAIGGGKGGNGAQTTTALGSGGNGGSGGGGGGHLDSYPDILGGAGTTNQGNNGGNGDSGTTTTELSGGGGGGASQVGSNGIPQQGGAGGSGLYLGDVFGINYGENGWFAGGGGGGAGEVGSGGLGGIGGGGDGGDSVAGGNASANTGGGGGAGGVDLAGGNGGSGIVIIRYTRWVDGRHDKALEFDGVRNYVNMGDVLDIGTSDWSYGVWFKADWTTANQEKSIIAKSRDGGAVGRYFLIFENGSLVAYLETSVGTKAVSTSETPYLDGEWHSVFVTIDRDGLMTLYVDSVSKATVSVSDGASDNYNTSFPLGLGAYQSVDGSVFDKLWFDGLIDDVRIYNCALTEDEIKFLYQRGVESHVNR